MARSALNKVNELTDLSHSVDECEDLLNYDGCDDTRLETENHSDVSCINPEVYLSLMWHSGYLGIAFYDVASLQVHVMADAPENDDFLLVKQIIREVQPKVVVLSSLHDSSLVSCLKKQISDESPMSEKSNNCKLEFLPNSDFSYEVSKRRIISTHLPSVPQHFSDEERKLYFASLLGLGSTCMVRSIGGLLKYLDKMRVGVELEDAATHVPLLGFRVFTLESQVQIDIRTYFALHIFRTELHPSVFKFGACSSKEGLSLFGVLNRCKSSMGSRMLRQWFLRPVRNASMLQQRYDALSFFLKPCNMEAVSCLQGCLKHIKYIPRILLRMSKAQATIADWIALSKTMYHAVYIGETCRTLSQGVEIFRKIGIAFTEDLHRCYNLLCKTIDFEASKESKRFVVQAHVDEKLDAKKCTFNGLPDLMSRVAREELKALNDDIKACVVSYLPQIGYLLVIDMPEGQSETDDHTIDGLEYKFASDNQLFYKSPRTLELDTLLGDTQLEIIDMEVAIMHHLQDTILEKTQLLLDVMEMAAELDCLMSLATCANEFGYVCPTLTKQAVLKIKNGRHPLQELCCGPYVPNDTSMGGQHTKMKLLTGPNACGKSVYLKQVGLIVFMAHIGSFVPAEKASIGPVDKIFSCIKSLESVSEGLSTFMQDNIQVSDAVQQATSNSVVLIDEFGKGTESTDGLSLLTAVIKFWIAKGPACPLVLVSTHFHSIIQQNLLPPSTQLQFLTLDTVMNGEELVFLYQIREGHTSSSYAANIAAQVGMSPAIIKRGKEVSDLLAQNKPVSYLGEAGANLQYERYERIVNAFLRLNLDTDDLHGFLQNYVLPLCTEQQPKPTPATNPVAGQSTSQVPEVSYTNNHSISQVIINKNSKQSEIVAMRGNCVDIEVDETMSRDPPINTNTQGRFIDHNLTKDKTNGLSKDQGLTNGQENRNKIIVRPEKSKSVAVTTFVPNRDKNISCLKNPSDFMKEQFIKTPLVEKTGEKTNKCLFKKYTVNALEGNITEIAQDRCTLNNLESQQPTECYSRAKVSEKRKADINFLFPVVPKQTKSCIQSAHHLEKQSARNGKETARRQDTGNESSSSTISPSSETGSEREQEMGFTTHISSTESQKSGSMLQVRAITSALPREMSQKESEEQTCDSGTSDGSCYVREQDKLSLRKPVSTDLSTSS